MSENLPDPSAHRQSEEMGCGRSSGNSKEQQGPEGGRKGCPDVLLTVGLEPEYKRMLEAKAKRLGISVSELIGKILRADLSHLSPPTKYLLCLFVVFAAKLCLADSFTGIVTRVIDPPRAPLSEGAGASRRAGGDHASRFTNTVVRVIDGDTITVGTKTVRLAGVDAPELKDNYGLEARNALSNLVCHRTVVVHWEHRGRYRRIIGHIFLNGQSACPPHCDAKRNCGWVNYQIIALGWARHFRRYSKDPVLAQAEQQARRSAAGIWTGK